MNRPTNARRSKTLQTKVVRAIASDPAARDLLVKSGIPRRQPAFVEKLIAADTSIVNVSRDATTLIRVFLEWCANAAKAKELPKKLKEAIQSRTLLQRCFRQSKRRFVEDVGLADDPARRKDFISKMPTIAVTALETPYPPLGHWIYETEAIRDHWEYQLLKEKQPDERKKRLPMHALVPDNLEHDIPEGESCIFLDSERNFVGMVARNVCSSEAATEFVDGAVKEATSHRKSVRLEDPGKIVQAGYSAGSRSAAAPAFDWVRNISGKHSGDKIDAMNAKSSSAFAFLWNMLRTKVPDEVFGDFTDFLAEMGSLRMDGNGQLDGPDDDGLGRYVIQIGNEEFVFCGVELAPPAGVCAENYSRATHYEFQPHRFGAAWTTSRSRGTEAGGHFFMCKYGIRIRAAPNTLIIWIPRDVHGTSLQDFSPSEKHPEFHQRGLVFVTGNRLLGAWKAYQASLITREEARKEVFGEDCDSGNEKFE